MSQWSIPFVQPSAPLGEQSRTDGGANRLYDLFENPEIEDGATARAL